MSHVKTQCKGPEEFQQRHRALCLVQRRLSEEKGSRAVVRKQEEELIMQGCVGL